MTPSAAIVTITSGVKCLQSVLGVFKEKQYPLQFLPELEHRNNPCFGFITYNALSLFINTFCLSLYNRKQKNIYFLFVTWWTSVSSIK